MSSNSGSSSSRIKEILSSVQFKVKFISVAPNMDLVLIVSESEEVLAYRFIQNWVKVWACSRTASGPVSALSKLPTIIGVAWEPSGKYCVIGHSDGTLAYCDVECGAIFVRIELDLAKYDETALASLRFSNKSELANSSNNLTPDLYDNLLAPSDLIPKYQCASLPDDQQVVFRALQRHLLDGPEHQPPSYLVCFGQKLNIYLLSGGFVLLAVIQLGIELSPLPLQNCLVFDCQAPTGDILAVCEYKMRTIKSFCVYRLTSGLMSANNRHISFLAKSMTDLIGCQEIASILITNLAEGLESVLFEFASKIDTLATSKKTANSGLVSTDFIQLLLLGRCSAETEQFFTLNMGERGLQRLASSLQKNFGGLLKQSISTLGAIADRMVLVSSRLMSLLKYERKLGDLKVVDENSPDLDLAAVLHRGALQFRLKIAQLHAVAQQDVGQLAAFVKFLQYEMNFLTAKQQRDSSMTSQRADGTPSGSGKDLTPLSSDDIKAVIAFIERNFVEDFEQGKCSIRFDRIAYFFKGGPDPVDTDAIVQNPWVSFMLDVETTPLVVGANDIAQDLDAILPRNDLDSSLVQSLQTFSSALKAFIAATVIALSGSFSADWCAKLPILNLGDCVVSGDARLPICGAFVDRDSGQLLALRVNLKTREARIEAVNFAAAQNPSSMMTEDPGQALKVSHILAANSSEISQDSDPDFGLGVYVVLENVQNDEHFGQMFSLSERTLGTGSKLVAPFKKLDAVPACVLLAPQVSAVLGVEPDSKTISFGRLHASSDTFFIASTGRALIILQPAFQLLRAFPGLLAQS